MTDNIAKIRAALEMARDYITSDLASERGAFEGYEGLSRIGEIKADIEENEKALAALSELEKAAADPVATVLGIVVEWTGEQPPEAGTKLYAAPPAPVAEIREPTPEECERIYRHWEQRATGLCRTGRDAFDAVRAVMWPKEGL